MKKSEVFLLVTSVFLAVIITSAYNHDDNKGNISALHDVENKPHYCDIDKLNTECLSVLLYKLSGETNLKSAEVATTTPEIKKVEETGIASWYDYTIEGAEWSKNHLTCASRTLKRHSMARVTNLDNGESVDCYVNDYIVHPDRAIDLSSYAFLKIAPLKLGLINVKIEQL